MFDAKKLTRHQIIGIGLKEAINHEMDKMAALEDEFGAMSIRSTCSIASVSNDLVRTLPSSRLREASVGAMATPAGSLSRTLSVRSTKKPEVEQALPPPSPAAEKSGALRRQFRELCSVNVMELVKSFTLVKEKEFYPVLLNLERALAPQVCHFDVVLARPVQECPLSGETGADTGAGAPEENRTILQRLQESSWGSFTKLLGTRLTKGAFQEQGMFLARQGRVPSDIMSELILEQRRQQQQQPQSQAPKARPASEESATLSIRRNNLLTDLVLNEVSYLRKLQLIDEYFLGPMDPTSQGPDPMGVRGLLHGEDYKFIFEGFPDIMRLHVQILGQLLRRPVSTNVLPSRDQLLRLAEEGELTGKLVAEVLLDVCKSKGFTIYANICDDFYERCRLLRRLCDGSPRLCDYLEHVAHDPRSNRLVIDQVMGSVFQMITRYALQLKAIVEATTAEDESVPLLEEAISRLDDTVAYIEHFKKRRDDTTNLFQVQRTIDNCPPNLCQPRRIFLMKMAAYEAVKGEVDFGRRLTLFLFNDIVIGARKRRAKEGRLSDVFLGGGGGSPDGGGPSGHSPRRTRTHDFMFLCPIAHTALRRLDVSVRARKGQAKVFALDIPGDAVVWLHDRQVQLDGVLDEYPANLLLVPKKQEKLTAFLEKFNHCKHQQHLAGTSHPVGLAILLNHLSLGSPAEIFVRQWEGQDVYFHVYKQDQYAQWPHRSRTAVLYCDQAPMPDLWDLFPEGQCDALMVVQVLNGAFRFVMRSREMIVASTDCFESVREFQSPEQLLRRFSVALTNCHLLHSIYPPFGPQLELQLRQHLVRHIEPFSRGLYRRFKEMTNRLQRTAEVRDQSDDGSSLYSVESNSIAGDDIEAVTPKKKSVLGKVLGKLKSPLGK